MLRYVGISLAAAAALALLGLWMLRDRDPRWVVSYARFGTKFDHRLAIALAVVVDAVLGYLGSASDASGTFWAVGAVVLALQIVLIGPWLLSLRRRREPLVWRHFMRP